MSDIPSKLDAASPYQDINPFSYSVPRILHFIMRFLKSIGPAVFTASFANGSDSLIGNRYCRALTQNKASRCIDDLCTFENGLDPKYSCSQASIEDATRIYEVNVSRIRQYTGFVREFPKQYREFLIDSDADLGHVLSMTLLLPEPGLMEFLEPILNIVLYIPNNILRVKMSEEWEWLSQIRDEVVNYKFSDNDHAYACIAVLGMIGIPVHLIRYTLEGNLRLELTELYKYTTLSDYMAFSIEERLLVFELIKQFHKQ